MKRTILTALLGLGMSAASLAAEPFRVYAPASKTQTLWIVDAVPKQDGGLELKLAEKRDLGFNGQVIAAHPKKPLLYIAGGGSAPGKVPGAVVTLAKNGTYASHQRVDLNDDAAYLSLDRSGATSTAAPDLSKVTSRADLDAVIAATTDVALKQAIIGQADAIIAAAERHPHVAAVIATIEKAPGTFTKINTTPEALNKAAGGDLPIFDTLTQVSTSILGGKAHDHRKESEDPYNAAFIEHLGHISSLEAVKLEASGIQDSWVAPLLKLKNLKSLSVSGFGRLGDASLAQFQQLNECRDLTNLELAYFGKATDAGWEKLAGLKNLESFTPRGAGYPGHFFAKFEGWTKLKRINFHSNGLDDEGFGHVCENFPNLEFIKLWHSKLLTDASAEHLKKLKKLTGMEISCSKATAGLIKHLRELPMEYVALEYGVNAPAADAIDTVKAIPTLRRLKLAGNPLTDANLAALAAATQLVELSFHVSELTDERLPQLKAFSFLKSLRIDPVKTPFSPETQAKVKALLPKVEVAFGN